VRVNGVVIDESSQDGWTYDAGDGAVHFHGAEVPPSAATIEVLYERELECL
jgi:hypothetical protein